MDDEDLLRRFRAGDLDAFELLLGRHEEKLARYLVRLTGDHALALDVAQETFLTLIRMPAGAREPDAVRAWLYQVARNRARDSIKKEARMRTREQSVAQPEAAPATAHPLEHEDEACAISRRLESLPAEIVEVLCLKVLDGMTYREIAAVTGHSTSKIGSLVHDGLTRLTRNTQAPSPAAGKEEIR